MVCWKFLEALEVPEKPWETLTELEGDVVCVWGCFADTRLGSRGCSQCISAPRRKYNSIKN